MRGVEFIGSSKGWMVARQRDFIEKYYGFGLNPIRVLFREAMKLIQRGYSVDEVMDMVIDGSLQRRVLEKFRANLTGRKRLDGGLKLQNFLIGPASVYARYLLCMKYKMLGHVPIKEHRRLTGELLKEWCKEFRRKSIHP